MTQTHSDTTALSEQPIKVYYDGACPVCRREISLMQRQATGSALDWVDASRCDETSLNAATGGTLNRQDALARMHVRDKDGTLVSGAAAFGLLWQQLPRFRWLGKVVSSKPALVVLEPAYTVFLKVRKLWRPSGKSDQ